jgi:hypothetical protein
MSTSDGAPAESSEKWFVEEFHLHSPVEEFQEFARLEIERLRSGNPKFDDSTHREAVDRVLRKLRPERLGSKR